MLRRVIALVVLGSVAGTGWWFWGSPAASALPPALPMQRTWECSMGNRCIEETTQCQPNPNLSEGGVVISACKSEQGFTSCWYQGSYYCKGMTPAERAEMAERQRAEQARRAELARIARIKQDKIDALVARWGEHRRGEAERAVEMELAASAARQRPLLATPPDVASTSRPPPRSEGERVCTQPARFDKSAFSWWARPMGEINRDYAEARAKAGTACNGTPGTIGPLICPKQATLFYTIANCDASLSCPARQIKCGPRATAQ